MVKVDPSLCGVIVGCNSKQEYLLPYFYLNLRLNSSLPILFCDFGMSAMGRSFCEKRGQVLLIEESLWATDSLEAGDEIKTMWFKKPLACKMAPFSYNLWLDLDCKVIKPLDQIFDQLENHSWLAICQEQKMSALAIYNSGVIVFKQHSPFIELWIKASKKQADSFRGDQDVLSDLLQQYPDKISPLARIYNHLYFKDQTQGQQAAAIIHYIGPFKSFLHTEHLLLEKSVNALSRVDTWIEF